MTDYWWQSNTWIKCRERLGSNAQEHWTCWDATTCSVLYSFCTRGSISTVQCSCALDPSSSLKCHAMKLWLPCQGLILAVIVAEHDAWKCHVVQRLYLIGFVILYTEMQFFPSWNFILSFSFCVKKKESKYIVSGNWQQQYNKIKPHPTPTERKLTSS